MRAMREPRPRVTNLDPSMTKNDEIARAFCNASADRPAACDATIRSPMRAARQTSSRCTGHPRGRATEGNSGKKNRKPHGQPARCARADFRSIPKSAADTAALADRHNRLTVQRLAVFTAPLPVVRGFGICRRKFRKENRYPSPANADTCSGLRSPERAKTADGELCRLAVVAVAS